MITQGQTTSFKKELYQGIHDLDTDTIKIALYTANADINQNTTVYITTEEVVGAGYVAGGEVLTNALVSSSGNTAYVTFSNVSWTSASFTSKCALIYNSSKGNKSIAVLDFGSSKTTTSTFTITFPADTATSAIIRST